MVHWLPTTLHPLAFTYPGTAVDFFRIVVKRHLLGECDPGTGGGTSNESGFDVSTSVYHIVSPDLSQSESIGEMTGRHVLSGGMYREQEISEGLAGFRSRALSELIEASKVMRRSDWVRFVRQSASQAK